MSLMVFGPLSFGPKTIHRSMQPLLHVIVVLPFPLSRLRCNMWMSLTFLLGLSRFTFIRNRLRDFQPTFPFLSFLSSHPGGSSLSFRANMLRRATRSRLCWYRSKAEASRRMRDTMCFTEERLKRNACQFKVSLCLMNYVATLTPNDNS